MGHGSPAFRVVIVIRISSSLEKNALGNLVDEKHV